MATINLRDLYPDKKDANGKCIKKPDCFIEVPDGEVDVFLSSMTEQIADVYFNEQRKENAYLRQLYKYKAYYSLDRSDGMDREVIYEHDSPFTEYQNRLTKQQLYNAIHSLPDKQAKRIFAHYFLGMSLSAIAKAERVYVSTVHESISSGLRNLMKYLKSYF